MHSCSVGDKSKIKTKQKTCQDFLVKSFGDRVKTYTLGTMFGTIKEKFRDRDRQSYDGSIPIVRGDTASMINISIQVFD